MMQKQFDIDAIPGEKWFPKESSFTEDMKLYWGDWGVCSEVEKLKACLMRRPGLEIENFEAKEVRFSEEALDVELMRRQHDNVANIYREFGTKVYYVEEQREDRPNAIYCRDLMFMTMEGAIVTRPGMASRRGEERYVAQALGKLGVPIVRTINGEGIFEGANAMWVDRYTCVLSTGIRCNKSGYDQVAEELRRQGVTDIIPMQLPYSNIHIDGLLNAVSNDVVMAHVSQVPYDVLDALKRKGYKILEIPSQTEARNLSCNFVALQPGHLLMAEGNPRTQELLENHGIKVTTVNISEILKGRGSLHCITAYLKRG
ncbi:MAG: amidinotransferase [Clostridia bacterium]|nr:amidinotransferase [Clostridia bacterium]